MKTKLLFIFLLVSSFGFAQLTLQNDSLFESFNPNVDEEDVVIHNFLSAMPNTEVKWEIYSIDVPATWTNDVVVCDLITCHTLAVNSNQYTILDNKKTAFDVHFYNGNNAGVGTVKLLVYEVADSANTAKIATFVANIQEGVGIKQNEKIAFSVYPNPTSSFVYLNASEISSIDRVEIYNIIGKKVKSQAISNNKTAINVSDLDKGVYIVKVLADNNTLFHTQSFVKN